MIKKLCQRIIFLVTNLQQDKCQLKLLPVETKYFLDKFHLISFLSVRKYFSKKLLNSTELSDLTSSDSGPVLICHSLLSANQPLCSPSLSILMVYALITLIHWASTFLNSTYSHFNCYDALRKWTYRDIQDACLSELSLKFSTLFLDIILFVSLIVLNNLCSPII